MVLPAAAQGGLGCRRSRKRRRQRLPNADRTAAAEAARYQLQQL